MITPFKLKYKKSAFPFKSSPVKQDTIDIPFSIAGAKNGGIPPIPSEARVELDKYRITSGDLDIYSKGGLKPTHPLAVESKKKEKEKKSKEYQKKILSYKKSQLTL